MSCLRKLLFRRKKEHQHLWRPCVTFLPTYQGARPSRKCDCGVFEPLTEQQFYAQFGEQFYVTSQEVCW